MCWVLVVWPQSSLHILVVQTLQVELKTEVFYISEAKQKNKYRQEKKSAYTLHNNLKCL